MPEFTRRGFLGLIGGALALVAAPTAFFKLDAETGADHPTSRVFDFIFVAPKTGIYTVKRANGTVLMNYGLQEGTPFRWYAPIGQEIVLLPNEPFIELHGPELPTRWDAAWVDHEGYEFVTSVNNGISETIPMRAPSWT